MIYLRKADERGYFDHGWLKTHHSFSFSDYYDQRFMGFRSLRVINEDVVAPAEGFPTHGHQNMEIITYILQGALEHKDSMGSGSVIRPGDVQYMSAGNGVRHSEFNHSKEDPVHLLQIWIVPEMKGGSPLYAEKNFSEADRKNKLCAVASPDGREGSIAIRQNAVVYASLLDSGEEIRFQADKNRFYWVQLAKGRLEVNGILIESGDGLALGELDQIQFKGASDSEFIVFDLA
jgi:redox-sensitive bicupin YhaK (pirin superfamily)